MPDWMKPDKIRALFTPQVDNEGVVVHVDPGYPNAHYEDPLRGVLAYLYKKGVNLVMVKGDKTFIMHEYAWIEAEQIKHPDGKIEAKLKGYNVTAEYIQYVNDPLNRAIDPRFKLKVIP